MYRWVFEFRFLVKEKSIKSTQHIWHKYPSERLRDLLPELNGTRRTSSYHTIQYVFAKYFGGHDHVLYNNLIDIQSDSMIHMDFFVFVFLFRFLDSIRYCGHQLDYEYYTSEPRKTVVELTVRLITGSFLFYHSTATIMAIRHAYENRYSSQF